MKIKLVFVVLALMLINTKIYANDGKNLENEILYIRYNVTAIEHNYSVNNKAAKTKAYGNLIEKADKLIADYPNAAEPYLWKAISLSGQAKYKGATALANVKSAKSLLEKSISINPKASNAAAYNTLGILYHKVPAWPVAYGDDAKAEAYFQKALSISSNLDTNYRYGEFLIDTNAQNKGISYLKKALAFPDRPNRKEDSLKKEDIKALLKKYNN